MTRGVRIGKAGVSRWVALALAVAVWPSLASAETLADAIALAYQTNPSLLAARADLRSLDERYVQARGALGPTASASVQESYDSSSVQQPASIFSSATTAHDYATTDNAQVGVTQPLYDNGALSIAVQAAQADVLGGRQKLRLQESQVLAAVITAYADVLTAQDLETVARQNVDILTRQLAETQAKVDVKENTLTDRAQASARLTAAQINLQQAASNLTDARARYAAVIGAPPGDLAPLPDLPGIPADVDSAFDAGERANPELLAAVYAEQASRVRVAGAKAADGLQVSVSASVVQQPAAPYIGNQTATGFIGSVTVSQPLFLSGGHFSRVREAAEANNGDVLRLSAEQRQVAVTIAQAWSDLVMRRKTLTGLAHQLDDEDVAFRGSQIEERVGLRTTIDVLNAEQEYQATKVALAQAYHDEYLGRVGLLAAMGLLEAELLAPDLDIYRPEASLNSRLALSRALPWEELVARLDSIGAPHVATQIAAREPLPAIPTAPGDLMPPAPSWTELAGRLSIDPHGTHGP
jgi:outer membrane protein